MFYPIFQYPKFGYCDKLDFEDLTLAPFPPHTKLKKSPREKRKRMERRNGARAERRVREALVGMISSSRKKFAHWL